MNKRQKKPYESPTTFIVWQKLRFPLLAGSDTIEGYGERDDSVWGAPAVE